MNWPWQISDEEYLDKVRRTARWRRSFGVFTIMMSLCGCGGVGFIVHTLQTGSVRIYGHAAEQTWFQMGAMTGFVGGICVFMAAQGLILGLWACLPDRGSKLLLEYHQQLTDLGQPPINSSESANSSASQNELM